MLKKKNQKKSLRSKNVAFVKTKLRVSQIMIRYVKILLKKILKNKDSSQSCMVLKDD